MKINFQKSGEPQTPELSVDELLKPKEIKTILDEYVIGQDHAKVTLSVAVTITISVLFQKMRA